MRKQKVEIKALKFEGKPLLVSLIPIVFIATWCFARIAYLPLKPDKQILIRAYFSIAKVGSYAHIVPKEGMKVGSGWIQRIKESQDNFHKRVNGVAEWDLYCVKKEKPYILEIQFDGETYRRELIIDGIHYSNPFLVYKDKGIESIEVVTEEYKPFGVVKGYKALQPWVVGYLILVIPFSYLVKSILHIY